jgi:hypothetical protein
MDVYQRRRLVALSALAAVFILFVLLIKSCGGDDDSTDATPLAGATGAGGATTLTQAGYVDQGDAICLDANTSLANVDQGDPSKAAKEEANIVEGELQQLQSLPQPDDGTTKLGNYLNALEKQAAAYQDRATAVDRGDDATVSELESTISKAGDEAAKAAKNFGFAACGNPDKVSESSGGSGGGTSGGTGATTSTDTGGTVTPTTTTVPIPTTTTTPIPTTPTTTPPADTGGGAATPPSGGAGGDDTGGTSSSGGVSP